MSQFGIEFFQIFLGTFFLKIKCLSTKTLLLLKVRVASKDIKRDRKFNILRFFDILPNFSFTTSETGRHY